MVLPPEENDMTTFMKRPRNILIAICAVVGLIIVFQNTESVQTKLLFATITMPRALLLGVTMVLGVAIGYVLGVRHPVHSKD